MPLRPNLQVKPWSEVWGRPDAVALGACLAAGAIAVACLAGWSLNLPVLRNQGAALGGMDSASALGVLVLASCIGLKRKTSTAFRRKVVAGLLVLSTGTAITLMLRDDCIIAGDMGSLLISVGVTPQAWAFALCLFLASAALALVDGPLRGAVPCLLLSCAFAPMLSVIGFLYSGVSAPTTAGSHPVSLDGGLALILLCVGVACLRPRREPFGMFFSRTMGGTAARWLLPAMVAVPVAVGWLHLRSQAQGLYSPQVGAALCAATVIAILGVLTWRITHVIHTLDLQRTETEELFTVFMDNSPAVAFMKDECGRYVYANASFYRLFSLDAARLLGRDAAEVFPESSQQLVTDDAVVLESGRAVEFNERVRTADGLSRDWLAFKFPLKGRSYLGGVAIDVTEHRRDREKLAEAERCTHATLDALDVQIASLDEHGTILAVNRAWEKFGDANGVGESFRMGVGGNFIAFCDQVACSCASLNCPSSRGCWSRNARRLADGIRAVLRCEQHQFCLEYGWGCPNHRSFAVRVTRLQTDGPARVVMAHDETTARRRAETRVRRLALRDSLTRLPNRNLLQRRVEGCVRRSMEHADHQFAVLFMDLDRFKIVNDSLGHALGDNLLIAVAGKLEDCLRSCVAAGCRIERHLVARMGGDEFIILLDGIREQADATRVADRIIAVLNEPCLVDGHEVRTPASIGIAGISLAYDCAGDVIRDADAAMYRAKVAGKGRFVVFDRSMHEEVFQRLQLEGELHRAMARRELRLHYQPIISLQDGNVIGFEALVRWQHPVRGLLLPGEFIPLAEETGAIGEIGEWVLKTACRQLRKWQQRFPGRAAPLTMSVNLSGRQLSQPDLPSRLAGIIQESGIDPATLKLEITESIMIANAAALEILPCLRALGVGLHMDDFGTGYSSLACLHRFPLDGMKVDRSFVVGADSRSSHRAVLEAVVALTRGLGIKLVVEGVETERQLSLLRELKCEQAQGFLFSTALETGSASALLESMAGRRESSTPRAGSLAADSAVQELLAC